MSEIVSWPEGPGPTMFEGVFDCREGSNDALQDINIFAERDKSLEHTAGFVIVPPCRGTLKSTRMRTRLSVRSISVMDSLLARDMVDREGTCVAVRLLIWH